MRRLQKHYLHFCTPQSLYLCVFGALCLMIISCQDYAQPERLRRYLTSMQKQTKAKPPQQSQQTPQNQSVGKAGTPQKIKDSTDTANSADTIPLLTHRAIIRTSVGEIVLGLYGKDAPQTVENFVRLSEKKFFRGIQIHRVARDFVVQTGDPKTKDKRKKDEWGTGGESAFGEPFEDEISPEAPGTRRGYRRGTVAMATRYPDANTSQFFICLRDIPELPLRFTIFGEVLEGWSVLEAMNKVELVPQLNENDGRPVKSIVIKNVAVAKTRTLARK